MSSSLPVPHLRGRGCRFTIIPSAGYEYTTTAGKVITYTGKNPQGKGWAKEGVSNYGEDDRKLQEAISRGWNHGLVTGTGGVVPFDADEAERLQELGIVQKIPTTIMVESRPGHRHHHLLCPELKKKFAFFDPIWTKWALKKKPDPKPATPRKFKFERVRVHLGEVLGPGGHAVLPGSIHPSGTKYHFVEGCPEDMAEITLDQLKEICRGLEFTNDPDKHITFEAAAGIEATSTSVDVLRQMEQDARKTKRTNLQPLSDQLDVQAVLDAYSWAPTRVDGAEAKGIGPCHGSTNGDDFQINLKTGRWHCKRCNAGGDLASLVALFEGIIPSCSDHDLLSRDLELFAQVVKACEKKGLVPAREKARPDATKKAQDFLEANKDGLKADHKKLLGPDVLRELATLQKGSPVGFELLIKEIGINGDMKKALRKELRAITDGTDGDDEDDPGSALATVVGIVRRDLEMDPEARFVYDQVGQAYLYLQADGHHVPMPLDSQEFGVWAAKTAMERYNLPLARRTIREADLSIMAAGEEVMAQKGMDLKVHMAPRVNMVNGSLWYDLGTEDMMGVEVNADEVAIRPLPLGLVRHPTDLPQVIPDLDADPLEIWRLMDFMPGVQMEDFLFLMSWAVGAFIPYWESKDGPKIHLPCPVPGFIGPKGSTKTVSARFLLKLIDPDAQETQEIPDNPRDMGIVLHGNRAVIFDNVTKITEWQSNQLCGGVTGGSRANRKLRTDSETVVHDYNARTMFTSVIMPEFGSDMVDRSLLFFTHRIPPHQKRAEALLFQEFELARPRIMGAIFRTLQMVLAIYPKALEESKTWGAQVRMSDFCVIGECCARVWRFDPGLLRCAYVERLEGDSAQTVAEDNVILALRSWVWSHVVLKEEGHWEGTVSELKEALEATFRTPPMDWPAKPNRFSGKLRTAQEDLARAGIFLEIRRSKFGAQVIIDAPGDEAGPIGKGDDNNSIVTSIVTQINAIKVTIGDDGDDSVDEYTGNKTGLGRPSPYTPPIGEGDGPEGPRQKSPPKGDDATKPSSPPSPSSPPEANDSVSVGDDRGDDGVSSGDDGGLKALPARQKKRESEDAERTKTPEPKGPTSERSDTKKGIDRSKPKKEGDQSKPEDDGRVFEKTVAYWRDLTRQHNGLTVRVLKDELGYDDLKAGMALHALRGRGWKGDEARRLHPPSEGVSA